MDMYFLLGDDENVLDSGGICELYLNYLERVGKQK